MSENEILSCSTVTFLKPAVHEPTGKVGHDLLLSTDVDTHTLL